MSTPDYQVIPKFISSCAVDAFKMQAQLAVEIALVQSESPTPFDSKSVLSVIGLKSSSFSGSLGLCFPEKTYLNIINSMLGENYTSVSRDNTDGASELLNIIFASSRVKINECGFDFQPAIPSVVLGDNLEIALSTASKLVKMTCRSSAGDFFLLLHLKKLS